ncbi:MAG: DUF559 domain-containing protein [Armatimonadetes bacterium]|nr:DUF559 domain-containing protein [Armatimonadota bacterium]
MPRNRGEAAKNRARKARKGPSVVERQVWESLRDGRLGFKFRREHPVGPYRLDFFCREAMLCVELDGEQHEPSRDAVRDRALQDLGIATYRIPNRRYFMMFGEVFANDLLQVQRQCEERTGRKAFPDP